MIIWTLIRREVATRFGEGALAYLWAIAVPLSWIGFGLVAFSMFERAIPVGGPPAVFLMSGILPYVIFRQSVTYILRASQTNMGLLRVPGICRWHQILAYALLEALTCVAICSLVILTTIWITSAEPPQNPLVLGFAFVLAWVWGSIIGTVCACYADQHPSLTRIVPLALRPFFWISGVFFLARELPSDLQKQLAMNPLFQITDLVREAWYWEYQSPIFSFQYQMLSTFAGVTLILAILLRFDASKQRAAP
ncbi:MAG: ABC transporter permease [Pseudomonadota bacterium]